MIAAISIFALLTHSINACYAAVITTIVMLLIAKTVSKLSLASANKI